MGRPKKQAKGAEGPTPTESYKELLKPPYLDQVESHFRGVSEIIPGGNKTKYSELFRRFFLIKIIINFQYASSFAFDGNHVDSTPSDSESLRRKSALVAIDALPFRSGSTSSQFKEDCVKRELNKAYVGFMAHEG